MRNTSLKDLLLVAVIFCLATPANAGDGQLLSRTTITLSKEQRESLLARRPAAAAYIDSITVQSITYSSDGLKVKGYLVIPAGRGPFPCLISNRGGNREFGAISDIGAFAWLGAMAHWGYAVIASQYRGVAGGDGMEEFGGADVNDVLNLISVLESLPEADASRIGMWGASRGGMMTYLALARTDRLKAAVIAAGVSNSFDTVKRRPDMETEVYAELVPDWKTSREAALIARSAVRWADKLSKDTPILLIHGTADWRVDCSQSLEMANALVALKHPFRMVLLEGGDHGLSEYQDEEMRLTRDFLDHYVRDKAPLPDMEPHGR